MPDAGSMGLTATADGVRLSVRVAPRASANRILGPHGGTLKIALTAPPVEGAANKALVEYLAAIFAVPRAAITLEAGATSRTKRLLITGLSIERALQCIRAQVE